jgi:hypothetical protein
VPRQLQEQPQPPADQAQPPAEEPPPPPPREEPPPPAGEEQPPGGAALGDQDVLPTRLEGAELMLAHAAEAGIQLKPELIATIERARRAHAQGSWTIDIATQFWPAYSQLCAAIKPVTGETLAASASAGVGGVLSWYRLATIHLVILILPLSILMFINTSISNEISERIKENDTLALSLRDQLLVLPPSANQVLVPRAPGAPPVRTERETVTALQQFATANRFLYGRAKLLDGFVLDAERDPFAQLSMKEKHDTLELPVRLDDIQAAGFDKIVTYQVIRAFAKNVQQMNLVIYGAITAYLLPVLYALLGACAYALRSLSEQTLARTYQPSYAAFARIIIALIAGLVVGLFNNFTQGISLSTLAIAFLVGYAVEVFFSFLDAFLETLKKVRS